MKTELTSSSSSPCPATATPPSRGGRGGEETQAGRSKAAMSASRNLEIVENNKRKIQEKKEEVFGKVKTMSGRLEEREREGRRSHEEEVETRKKKLQATRASASTSSSSKSTSTSCRRVSSGEVSVYLDVGPVEGRRQSSSPPTTEGPPSSSSGFSTAPQPFSKGRQEIKTPDFVNTIGTLCAQTCRADRHEEFCKCKTTGETFVKVLTDQCVRTNEPADGDNSPGIRDCQTRSSHQHQLHSI